jgi:xanthosine utilization system XapX-like protein
MNMSLGAGIFVFVIGAVLAFAVTVTPTWIDLQLVGWIMMGAGLVIIILGIILLTQKKRSVVTRRTGVDPSTGQRYDTTERNDR